MKGSSIPMAEATQALLSALGCFLAIQGTLSIEDALKASNDIWWVDEDTVQGSNLKVQKCGAVLLNFCKRRNVHN